MYVNTKIVKALLSLRAVSLESLGAVTGISLPALNSWLDGVASDEDARIPFERQLEVLKVLGIVGEHPRADITHHWMIREPFFGNREEVYEPLKLMLACFGRAEVVQLTAEQDPWALLTARTHFCLTFAKFRAVLEILSSPLQSLAFNPDSLQNLGWAGSGIALVLEDQKFYQLTAPGEATPEALDEERLRALEHVHWNRLTAIASERGMNASQVAKLLVERVPSRPALTAPAAAPKKPAVSAAERQAAQASSNEIFVGRESPATEEARAATATKIRRSPTPVRKRVTTSRRAAIKTSPSVTNVAEPAAPGDSSAPLP